MKKLGFEKRFSSRIGVVFWAMLSPGRLRLSHAAHWLLAAVLLLLGLLAVVQPSLYLSLFTSRTAVYFVWFAGIVLLYFILKEDRA